MSAQRTNRSDTTRSHPPLVVIKAGVPAERAGLIRRHDLIGRMSDERDRQVTVLRAPAGYGKSTALLQWAREDPLRRFAWLTLEDTENDPALLWHYVLLALQGLVPGFTDLAGALDQPRPALEELITHVVNRLLDVPGRLVLVLDDYHLIEQQSIHEGLTYLLDHLPPTMHLVIASRTDPPLPLPRRSSRPASA